VALESGHTVFSSPSQHSIFFIYSIIFMVFFFFLLKGNKFKVGSLITEHFRYRENPLQERAKKNHGKIGQGSAG
jgi:hypothetical protein